MIQLLALTSLAVAKGISCSFGLPGVLRHGVIGGMAAVLLASHQVLAARSYGLIVTPRWWGGKPTPAVPALAKGVGCSFDRSEIITS